MKLFLHKLMHWEYWPFPVVYVPVYFLWAYYAVKSRSIFFFNACNPSIENGGFFNESKMEIYKLIPPQYYPETVLIKAHTPFAEILSDIKDRQIRFPMIAKPDMGLRGSAVKKIDSETELQSYAAKADFDFLAQNLIPYPNEIGIFYVRHPESKKGRITGIVAKEFLIVEGDGKATIETLLKRNPRFALQLKTLRKTYGNMLQEILPQGEKRNLVPYGNHCRGSKFLDASAWITPSLNKTVDDLCQQIDGFYFGRIDLMYSSLEELERGENFSIVEVNGASSEPTHIYDPKHSIFFGWKELLRHIRYMHEISAANHKKGAPYLTYKEGMAEFREHNRQNRQIQDF